jgi:hypothetical protein
MANNLFAYKISGGTVTLGVDTLSWNSNELNGNSPYVISASTTLSGYDNITSISNWDSLGGAIGLRHSKVRKEIKEIYDTNTGTTWSAYTHDDQKIVAKYFIVDKGERDEVYTDEEQDEFNYFKLYDFLSDDAFESLGAVNPKTTPKSIDYKKDLQQRLHPELKFDRFGFMTGCTYYENLSVSYDVYGFSVFTYDNPILKYDADYTFAANGYVSTRTISRRWYMMDGTLSDDAKVTFKIYSPIVARDESRRRRKNLISDLLIKVVGLFIMTSPDLSDVETAETDAIPFLKDINSAISAYYEYGTRVDAQGNLCQLIQEIAAHPYSRLNNFVPGTNDTVTVRMFIMEGLNPQ